MGDAPPLLTQVLVLVVPGIVVTAAFFPPGAIGIPARLTLAYAAGFATTSLCAWVLICFSSLNLWSFAGLLLAGTIAAAVIALRRATPRAHFDALRDDFRRDTSTLIIGFAVLVAIGWAMSGSSPAFSFMSDTPMRFWGDGTEIAEVGGIPDRTLQWGDSWRPATSKMLFNSHSAVLSLITPDALPASSSAMWLVSIFFLASLWWLGCEIGLRWLAPLLPILAVANVVVLGTELSSDLRPYRAEAFGRVVAFSALALALSSVREAKGWHHHLFVGALFGVAGATHLVPTVLCLAMLGGFCVHLLVQKSFTRRHLTKLAGALAVSAALLVLVWATPGANLAFEGTTKVDAGASSDIDPVELFVTGERSSLEEARQRTWYRPPGQLMSELVESGTNAVTDSPWLWLAGGIATLAALFLLAPVPLRAAAALAITLIIAIVSATLLFDRIYSTFALALFGPRRLFDYSAIPTWLLILIIATSGLYALEKARRDAPPIIAAATILVASIVLLPELRSVEPSPRARHALEELQWVRDNTECDARILSNEHSGGDYQVLTGRVSVNEGMGPFFRPDMLDAANEFLLDMNRFFEAPARQAEILAEYGIDYVVMVRGPKGADANIRSGPAFPVRMDNAEHLELLFEGRRSNIYRVTGVDPPEDLADPADHPGFDCERGPIPV